MSQGGAGTRLTLISEAERLARGQALMQVLGEACKAAVLINGGAAVALGAFLQATLTVGGFGPVRVALMWGIAFAALGVCSAAVTLVLRYFSLWHEETERYVGNTAGRWAMGLGIASLVTFVASIAVPLGVAFMCL